jgi:hypothetical protein
VVLCDTNLQPVRGAWRLPLTGESSSRPCDPIVEKDLKRMIKADAGRSRVSCVRWMRVAILLAVLFAANGSALADAISITSPNHPQTFTYGEMIWHQLYKRTSGELAVQITFSNRPYVGDDTPRTDESFDFRFPGVQFDSTRRAFFVNSRHGERIPVARFRDPASYGWVDLVPGAKIYLLKETGRVAVTLTATNYPRAGIRWIEMDNNFSLQNLLVALFRDFRVQPDN